VNVGQAFGAVRVGAAIFVPVDGELGAQDACGDEQANVEADVVVDVGVPAEGLLVQRLPALQPSRARLPAAMRSAWLEP
jgi:hypothetical protein